MNKDDELYPLFNCMQERKQLRAKVEQLEAQAAAMRKALEAVMWDELETGARYCIWCAVMFGSDHLSDCQGNNALAADAGHELLERLQRAERTLELLEAAGHVSQETANQAHKIVSSFEAEREP